MFFFWSGGAPAGPDVDTSWEWGAWAQDSWDINAWAGWEPDPLAETLSLTAFTSSDVVLSATITDHPMSNTLVVGSTNTVSLKGLKNTETHDYLDDATVVLTGILDSTDTPVVGTANLAMPYISGVGRKVLYQGLIPHTVALVAGQQYTRRITATDALGNVRVFDTAIIAEAG